MRRWPLVVLLVLLALAGCSSSSHSSSSTTTTSPPKSFTVDTGAGTVTVSLDGQLPPGWPSDFPVPPGATPAGSGSLSGSTSASMIAVFESTGSGQDNYNFYKNSKDLTITKSNGVGGGTSFVGHLTYTGKYTGSVTIADVQDHNLIVVTLTHHTADDPAVSGAR